MMIRPTTIAALVAILSLSSTTTSAFQTISTTTPRTIIPSTTTTTTTTTLFSTPPERTKEQPPKPPLSTLVNRVAVAGATGRCGKLVVQKLLSQNVPVVALVRDTDKATQTFDPTNELLTIRKTDLGSKQDVIDAIQSTEADCAMWCATGFSDSPDQSLWTKVSAMFGFATNSQGSIDAVGLPALGEALANSPKRTLGGGDNNSSGASALLPKVVMLSSAGVTRPDWTEEKKSALEGCAAIPIVRLNPFGILGVKKQSEEELRNCGTEYTIFRPGGLNDKWPKNSRPIFSQGDVAVGRINREDVADILVDLLVTPEATGKTFEGVSVANSEGYYPPADSLSLALDRLVLDKDGGVSEDVARATYAIMQQLLPGEKQAAAELAMGQTYEQLDKEEIGRLGQRGTEEAPLVKTG
mmetsp:Transcript_25463/g.39975  ORF Transcript_25463/g.39975 Transcript_25463/m.39975 type:complete len:412 (+) Transcript_25463:109-1344(+)